MILFSCLFDHPASSLIKKLNFYSLLYLSGDCSTLRSDPGLNSLLEYCDNLDDIRMGVEEFYSLLDNLSPPLH